MNYSNGEKTEKWREISCFFNFIFYDTLHAFDLT